MGKKWAKLAKEPGKASTQQLQAAIDQLEAEREDYNAQRKAIETRLADAYLEQAAGQEPPNLAKLEHQMQTLDVTLRAMALARDLLFGHKKQALEREKQQRIEEIKKMLPKLDREMQKHYQTGIKHLAKALYNLAQKYDFNPRNLTAGCDTVSRLSHTMLRDYREALGDRGDGPTIFCTKMKLSNELSALTKVQNIDEEPDPHAITS